MIKNFQVLMYHGVSQSGGHGTMAVGAFERQMQFLSRRFCFTSFEKLNDVQYSNRERILLTFDDGYHNNFLYVVPILRRLNIPAVFFVSHRHCQPGKYLWFSYLKALNGYFQAQKLSLRGNLFDFNSRNKSKSIQKIRSLLLDLNPHPSEMYQVIDQELPGMESFVPEEMISEYFSGMSEEELKIMARDELFTLGVHTADHAFLTQCSPKEARNQLLKNIDFLKNITSVEPTLIAYPSGDYNEAILKICREENLPKGFSVIPIRRDWNGQDIPRMGVYSSSLVKLMVKLILGDQLRSLNFKIG